MHSATGRAPGRTTPYEERRRVFVAPRGTPCGTASGRSRRTRPPRRRREWSLHQPVRRLRVGEPPVQRARRPRTDRRPQRIADPRVGRVTRSCVTSTRQPLAAAAANSWNAIDPRSGSPPGRASCAMMRELRYAAMPRSGVTNPWVCSSAFWTKTAGPASVDRVVRRTATSGSVPCDVPADPVGDRLQERGHLRPVAGREHEALGGAAWRSCPVSSCCSSSAYRPAVVRGAGHRRVRDQPGRDRPGEPLLVQRS